MALFLLQSADGCLGPLRVMGNTCHWLPDASWSLTELLVQTTAFSSLDVFSFERSADLLLVLIIGGAGYLYGGLIGSVIFKLVQDRLATIDPQYWQYWIGLLLVMMVLFGRVYGAVISLAIFAVAYWFKLSFFDCTIIMLLVGLGYKYIQQWIKLIDDRFAQLVRRARQWRSGAARQEA